MIKQSNDTAVSLRINAELEMKLLKSLHPLTCHMGTRINSYSDVTKDCFVRLSVEISYLKSVGL